MDVGVGMFLWGFILMLVGFTLLVTSLLLKTVEEPHEGVESKSKVSGGGVIVIGPIPIVFGSDKKATIIAGLIGIALTLLALITFFIMR